MSSRGNLHRESVRLGNCPFGEMSIGKASVGEVQVGDLSSRKCQSGNYPLGELCAYHLDWVFLGLSKAVGGSSM